MIVFAVHDGPRLRYTCSVIGQQLYGEPLLLTSDRTVYARHPGAKINYSDTRSEFNEIYIRPYGLLSETGIRAQVTDTGPSAEGFHFFRNDSDTGFDLFSAVFYLLSRYEEYLPSEKDMYGRYAHTGSLAFRSGFLHQPLADEWIAALKHRLGAVFPYEQVLHQSVFRFRPTYDIDIAWSYRHKDLLRLTAGWFRSVFEKGGLRRRIAVLGKRRPDPYDSFSWLDQLHLQHALRPVYFFLLARAPGIYDKNNNPSGAAMRALVRDHAERYTTGIHPSWRSGDDPEETAREIAILRDLSGREIILSRQHYIRFTLPVTYRRLAALGITDDYSMGYGSINGFRASTSFPFPWYDLEAERATSLMLHPFCFMDANSFYEQGLDPAATLQEMRGYYDRVLAVKGHLVMIWHNHFLGTDPKFSGWREIYQAFVTIAAR